MQDEPTPFERIGGADPIHAIADRFYTLMESDPAYAELRAMHAADLDPMRESLGMFLTAWLGGPRDWFEQHPGVCMMGMHRAMPITPSLADQWIDAMARAIAAQPGLDPELGRWIARTLDRMGHAMVTRAAPVSVA